MKNKLVSLNPVLRFKILKYQKAGKIIPLYIFTTSDFGLNFTNLVLERELSRANEALIRALQYIKADKRANRKASPVINNTAKLLDLLWKAGAFKGVKRKGKELTYEQAVDGIEGPLTDEAISNAINSGLVVDKVKGTISGTTKNNTNSASLLSTVNDPLKQKLEDALSLSVRKTAELLERFSRFTDEDRLKNNRIVPTGLPISSFPLLSFNQTLHKAYNNSYPYSYGDILVKGNNTIPYSRLLYPEIPEGYKLVQTTAETSKPILVLSMRYKFLDALKGEDPRTIFMNLLASLDISTPEGRRQYSEMLKLKPQGFVRGGGNPENALFEMRARIDARNAFGNNGLLLYDTWEYNSDYDSPTAKSRGRATYRIKDPNQRKRIYGEMTNYFLKHKNEGRWNDDHTAYILPHMGFMGNLAMIADDENGLNLRYGDWWDYLVNPSDGYVMYMGDRLVPEGTYPKWSGNRKIGHNTKEMTEAFDGNYLKELLLGNY